MEATVLHHLSAHKMRLRPLSEDAVTPGSRRDSHMTTSWSVTWRNWDYDFKIQCTASFGHLRTMLPGSSSRPMPAKQPNRATLSLFDSKSLHRGGTQNSWKLPTLFHWQILGADYSDIHQFWYNILICAAVHKRVCKTYFSKTQAWPGRTIKEKKQ